MRLFQSGGISKSDERKNIADNDGGCCECNRNRAITLDRKRNQHTIRGDQVGHLQPVINPFVDGWQIISKEAENEQVYGLCDPSCKCKMGMRFLKIFLLEMRKDKPDFITHQGAQ